MSGNGETRPMVENARDIAADTVKRAEAVSTVTRELLAPPAEPKKIPDGHVARTLNFQDRNLICSACMAYAKDDKGKYKGQFKVDRVFKLLNYEETVDYYQLVNDSQAENLFSWQEARQAYISWRTMKGGMMKVEEFVKLFPKISVDECPEKPPIKQPQLSDDDKRGKPREFHIPAKLDVFIQDALSEMKWNASGAEFVVELMEKYGIKMEE